MEAAQLNKSWHDYNESLIERGRIFFQKFTSDGSFITKWGSNGTGDGQFSYAGSVAVDSSGNVYVADVDRVQKFTSDGSK
jgi:hypothetical protein